MSVFLGIAAIFLYLGAFAACGILLPEKWHRCRLINIILLGFPTYFGMFQLVALPLKIIDVPLKTVSIIWIAVMLLVAASVIIFRRKQIAECVKNDIFGFRTGISGIVFILLVTGLIVMLVLNVEHLSSYDYSFYVGVPLSSVYGNTIENIDVYTGDWYNSQREFYIMNTGTLHSAVMFQIIGIHPVIEAEITLTAVMALLFILYLYKAGSVLFEKDALKAKMFAFFTVFVLMFSFGIAGTSMYFAYRAYEGKAVCSYLIPAAIFCFFVMIVRAEEEAAGWAGAFLTAVSGIAFSNSALFITPGLVVLLGTPYLLTHRDRKTLLRGLAVLAPSVIWMAIYHFL